MPDKPLVLSVLPARREEKKRCNQEERSLTSDGSITA